MSALDERFLIALHACARGWRQSLDRRLQGSGLSRAGWNAVLAIAQAPQPPSQTELAQLLGVEGATVVATVDRLVAAGMVERVPSRTDRRVKLVVATARGRELAARIETESAALRRQLLQQIDTQRMAVAATVLEQLRQMLEETQ
ncbi:MAG: MarR family winged helix-turn-helix transcriptional regulator [Massilia sp.]